MIRLTHTDQDELDCAEVIAGLAADVIEEQNAELAHANIIAGQAIELFKRQENEIRRLRAAVFMLIALGYGTVFAAAFRLFR